MKTGLVTWRSASLLLAALLAVAANGVASYRGLTGLADAQHRIRHGFAVREALAGLTDVLARSEYEHRAFLATRSPDHFAAYYAARATFAERAEGLPSLVQADPVQLARARRLQRLGAEAAAADGTVPTLPAADRSRREMDELRSLIAAMGLAEQQALADSERRHDQAELILGGAAGASAALALALLASLCYVIGRDFRHRRAAADAIAAKMAELDAALRTHERERAELAGVNEMSSFLQASNTVEQAAQIVPPYLARLFPGCAGTVHEFAASRNQLKLLARHDADDLAPVFRPDECWALRRGQPHLYVHGGERPLCEHLAGAGAPAQTLCLPMIAHGETVGLLSLIAPDSSGDIHDQLVLAEATAKRLARGLANLQLRDTLRQQSVRDPLTGLYNRRYMEEILLKEAAVADRSGRSLSVLMIDIDHFKRFNDSHGHAAGDQALIAVARQLAPSLRSSDWVFRYGGEEFLALLLDVGREGALARAEELRRRIAEMTLQVGEQAIHGITVSIGVGTYPDGGNDVMYVIEQADDALYRAKRQGRNRTAAAAARAQLREPGRDLETQHTEWARTSGLA